ncbi:MAG TPA: hypothetical protein VNF99_21610 [Stellaceae bacterium]|nr:hypothetical protein [Stellaceae bacterium]
MPRTRTRAHIGRSLARFATLSAAALFFLAPSANALPSYARQTGQQCAACHNGFPELTPYGRLFKLNGYTFGGGQSDLPPLAAMVIPSFTHTDAGQTGGAAPHYGANDNFALPQSASLFYGGAISSALGIGTFTQATYDRVNRRFTWDNMDIRYAKATTLGGETVFGLSLNNNPTVTDLWNTTPAWGYPFLTSELAPTQSNTTMIEGGFAQQVAGLNAYAFWNRLVYAEIGGYSTLTKATDAALGVNPTGTDAITGLAPYWRFALQPQWGPNSLEFGTFGMAAAIEPGRITGFGTDHKTDIGFDTQYQYLADVNSFSVQASWITEHANLTASQALGGATNGNDHLRSLRIKTSYYYKQTYGGTVGYFRTEGTSDPLLYGATSPNDSSPNTTGWIAEIDYMPFNHGGPGFWPWLNMKIGAQYIVDTKFDGAAHNYDGAGRNASNNNTLFLFDWIAF